MPHKHVDGTTLYYAWMYSPEVHASPEQWEKIFGKGKNTLPTLFDRVTTPDGAVSERTARCRALSTGTRATDAVLRPEAM